MGPNTKKQKNLSINFSCDLCKCKGACCAVNKFRKHCCKLTQQEISYIKEHLDDILPFLSQDAQKILQNQPFHDDCLSTVRPTKTFGNACIFAVESAQGLTCGLQRAFDAGVISLKKPQGCALFPLVLDGDDWYLDTDRYYCKCAKQTTTLCKDFIKDSVIHYLGNEFYKNITT